MHWKKSVLVIHKILRLFVNTLIVDDKHYLLNKDNLTQPIQMQLYQKQKNFLNFFRAFLKSVWNFKHLPKKLDPKSFPKYRLRKTWLDKCLKNRVSEDRYTDNMGNGSKQCCNLNDRTFTIFINHCECSCIEKSLF